MSETRTISLMPEPGTEAYERMRQWMRSAYSDPRNVRFRQEVTQDGANIGFLTLGGTDPLPEVKDPIRDAVEVTVTLLLDGAVADEDRLLADVDESLRRSRVAGYKVIDVLLADMPRNVHALDAANYRVGDHFQNPLDAPLNSD
jgi:hypothetical protein